MDVKKFDSDLKTISERVSKEQPREIKHKLDEIRLHLVGMYKSNLVKINHSVIELICAHQLLNESYNVSVERKIGENLVCDVYGERGEGRIIVEIETGFVPPSRALEPSSYTNARIISKIARYSPFADKFVLGTTVSNILPVPELFRKLPRMRTVNDINKAKNLCDAYYAHPPIPIEQITYGEMHAIFIIDVDLGRVRETSIEDYLMDTKSIRYERASTGPH